MAEIDTSSYKNALTAPVNPLDMLGKYQGIANAQTQNALLQQQLPLYQARTGVEQESLAQQQIKTREAQDIQGALGELKNFSNENGGTNYNAWLPQVATKYPLAIQTALEIKNKNIGTLVSGAYNEKGQPIVATPEGVSLAMGGDKKSNSNPFSNVPTAPAGVPFNTLPPTATTIKGNQPTYIGAPMGGEPGNTPSGPALGQDIAANVTSGEGAKSGVALMARGDQVPAQKALLGNLDSALDQFTSGPGSDWTKVGKAMANRISPFGDIFDPKSIASQEEFSKQAIQLAQSQFQALGGTGTDEKLHSALSTNPNEVVSKMGNKGIVAMLKGNEDAINIKRNEWQNWKKSHNDTNGATYGDFSADFNKKFDPRVFQAQYLSPDQRKQIRQGMTEAELNKFKQDYNLAHKNGWIE